MICDFRPYEPSQACETPEGGCVTFAMSARGKRLKVMAVGGVLRCRPKLVLGFNPDRALPVPRRVSAATVEARDGLVAVTVRHSAARAAHGTASAGFLDVAIIMASFTLFGVGGPRSNLDRRICAVYASGQVAEPESEPDQRVRGVFC